MALASPLPHAANIQLLTLCPAKIETAPPSPIPHVAWANDISRALIRYTVQRINRSNSQCGSGRQRRPPTVVTDSYCTTPSSASTHYNATAAKPAKRAADRPPQNIAPPTTKGRAPPGNDAGELELGLPVAVCLGGGNVVVAEPVKF